MNRILVAGATAATVGSVIFAGREIYRFTKLFKRLEHTVQEQTKSFVASAEQHDVT